MSELYGFKKNLEKVQVRSKSESVGKSHIVPTLISNTVLAAPAAAYAFNEMTIPDLSNWNVVVMLCKCGNIEQNLIYFRAANAYNYLIDALTSTVTRGTYHIDWTNNKIRVRWTEGNASLAQSFVQIMGVYGLVQNVDVVDQDTEDESSGDEDEDIDITGLTEEVLGIRIGADGTIYETAGEAVREQYNRLAEILEVLDVEDAVQTIQNAVDTAIAQIETAGGLILDPTLTKSGQAADAKVTGDKIASVKSDLDELTDDLYPTDTVTGKVLTVDDSVLANIKGIETEADRICRTGINLWDEQWELGQYSTVTGLPVYNQNAIRSKNPIPIHPETDYYFKSPYNTGFMFYDASDSYLSYQTGFNKKITSPANAYYMRFYEVSTYGTTYNNDIQLAFNTEADKTTYHAYTGAVFENVEALTLIPESKNYIYAVGSDDVIDLTYYKKESYPYITKKPYQSGFIVFTVPSRLTKSNNSVSASSVSELTDDSVNVNCILKLPSTYTPNGDPTKLIMICHGAGQSAESWATNESYIALVNAFTSAGYAVFDCNGYRENALGYSFWGDSRGVDVWRKAYQYVVNNYNVEHEFGLYGFSMGGLTALNLAFSGFSGIKCIALGSPVVSLEACYNSESVNAVIKVLYGMGNTYDPSLAYGCDPYARIMTINNKGYIFGNIPPIKMWYGSTETGTTDTGTGETVTGVVVKAYGEDIVEAINNAGGQAEYREVDGTGHEICYGGNSVVNNDLVLYFDRHNKI